MATSTTPAQSRKVSKVMHEFKAGKLKSSSGDKVKNPKQAIAIALSEAGADKNKSERPRTKRATAAKKAMDTREKKATGKATKEPNAKTYKSPKRVAAGRKAARTRKSNESRAAAH